MPWVQLSPPSDPAATCRFWSSQAATFATCVDFSLSISQSVVTIVGTFFVLFFGDLDLFFARIPGKSKNRASAPCRTGPAARERGMGI